MTTPIKTQCPHCHACAKIQQTQLNRANATVSCQHCQQSFLVNEHLIVTPDVPNTTSTAKTDTNGRSDPRTHSAAPTKSHNNNQHELSDAKSSLNKRHKKNPSSDTLIHDDLIYDDMDTDELEDSILEYDSLDSMDAWLTQANYASTTAHEPSSQSYKANNKRNSSASTAITEPVVLSSTAANNIHASIDNTADNSWLEQLLKEQNKKADTPPTDDTDLSQLLLDMGLPLKDDDSFEERVRKSQARFAPASGKHSIASLLWTLGCLLLALLLFAQYIIFNLETLVKNPVHAQRLQAICSIAACSLPSADLTAFAMTDSNHDSSRINNTATFSDVSATLANQSDKAQLYPNVKVSIYGANNLIGTFIATPTDYLLSKQHHLAANSEQKLLFTIPVANTKIREVMISPLY